MSLARMDLSCQSGSEVMWFITFNLKDIHSFYLFSLMLPFLNHPVFTVLSFLSHIKKVYTEL